MCADLTRAGYGPRPQHDLGWTAFYYLWYQSQMDQTSTQQLQRSWQMLTAHAGAGTGDLAQFWRGQEQRDQHAYLTLKAALWPALPPSVRRLISPVAAGAADEDTHWRGLLAECDPDTPQYAFYHAGWMASRARRGLEELNA